MMTLTPNLRKIICLVTVDLVCLLLVGVPCLLLWLVGKSMILGKYSEPDPKYLQSGDPYYRGFFCDDETLRHPYRDSTVPTWALVIASYGLPTIVFR